MRWGKTYDQINEEQKEFSDWVYKGHKWWAWRPVRLTNGRRVVFEEVWRFGEQIKYETRIFLNNKTKIKWKYKSMEEKVSEKLNPPPENPFEAYSSIDYQKLIADMIEKSIRPPVIRK